MNKEIKKYIDQLDYQIDDSRKEVLDVLANYIKSNDHAKLNFICTHNSRRSHLSQIWAQVMGNYHGISLSTYSGGTEATAFHPNAVAALTRAGFNISNDGGENPRYKVSYSDQEEPMICFSKTYDDSFNPQSDFAAVMTCSDADEGCPFVPGAKARIKLLYEDPKVADGTPEEANKYDERCAQIAAEMQYIFSSIK